MNPEFKQQIIDQNINSLDEVEAGHIVFISNSRSYSFYGTPKPVIVDRVTKTQIIINHVRYHRDGGQEIGGSKYSSNRIQLATPELLLSIEVGTAKRALRAMAEKITHEVGIFTDNASVTAKTLEQVMSAYSQLQAWLARLEGGNNA